MRFLLPLQGRVARLACHQSFLRWSNLWLFFYIWSHLAVADIRQFDLVRFLWRSLKLLLLLSRFDTFDLFMFILSMLIILLSRNQLVEINLFAVSIFGWILFLILRISFLDCRCRDGIRIFVDGCWSCSLCNEDESEGSFLGDEFSNLRRWHFVRNSFLDKKKLHFIKTVFFLCQYIIRMLNLLLKMGAWI